MESLILDSLPCYQLYMNSIKCTNIVVIEREFYGSGNIYVSIPCSISYSHTLSNSLTFRQYPEAIQPKPNNMSAPTQPRSTFDRRLRRATIFNLDNLRSLARDLKDWVMDRPCLQGRFEEQASQVKNEIFGYCRNVENFKRMANAQCLWDQMYDKTRWVEQHGSGEGREEWMEGVFLQAEGQRMAACIERRGNWEVASLKALWEEVKRVEDDFL
jgi:hypothetical protein